jgi:hypothetical protein
MIKETGTAHVLLIADDPQLGSAYALALEAHGYIVRQARSFVDTLASPMPDPDLVVLCNLAVLAHPGQAAQILRVTDGVTPGALVREVHRRVALRATLGALSGWAA